MDGIYYADLDGVNAISAQRDGCNTDKLWKEIVGLFRRLCFMRRMGRADEASRILRKDLPDMIARWSSASIEPYGHKRSRLTRMFQEEQRRVADAWTLHEFSLMQWQQEMVPLITQQITQEIKIIVASQLDAQAARQQQLGQEIHTLAGQFEQDSARRAAQESVLETVQKTVEAAVQKLPPTPVRIPFDDIQTIIDQINDEERRTPSARKKFSIRPLQSESTYRSGNADGNGGSMHTITQREVHAAVA